jgi:hypothetical protein
MRECSGWAQNRGYPLPQCQLWLDISKNKIGNIESWTKLQRKPDERYYKEEKVFDVKYMDLIR